MARLPFQRPLAALVLLGAAASAGAAGEIYDCVVNGKRMRSDRPLPECANTEQRLLNADGSVKRIIPPTPTGDEAAEAEARERAAALERANRQEAMRRDRNLLLRFPNEARHRAAREAALDDVRKALKVSQMRLEVLAKERKPLLDDAEFYVGKQMPLRLKQQLDANEAAADAQRNLVQNQQDEIVRINALYDGELERLRKLWAGAQPGSMGVLPVNPPVPATPAPALNRKASSAAAR